jgi:hypothetical protein
MSFASPVNVRRDILCAFSGLKTNNEITEAITIRKRIKSTIYSSQGAWSSPRVEVNLKLQLRSICREMSGVPSIERE